MPRIGAVRCKMLLTRGTKPWGVVMIVFVPAPDGGCYLVLMCAVSGEPLVYDTGSPLHGIITTERDWVLTLAPPPIVEAPCSPHP